MKSKQSLKNWIPIHHTKIENKWKGGFIKAYLKPTHYTPFWILVSLQKSKSGYTSSIDFENYSWENERKGMCYKNAVFVCLQTYVRVFLYFCEFAFSEE